MAMTGQELLSAQYRKGLACEQNGDYEQAMAYFQEALCLKKSALRSKPDVSTLLRHVGCMQFRLKNYSAALECYEELLSIMKATSFRYDDALEACEKSVLIYRKRHRLDKVANCYRDLCETTEKNLGENCEEAAFIIHKLGSVYHELGRSIDAAQTFQKERQIREGIPGSDLSQIKKLTVGASLNMKSGGNAVALEQLERALNLCVDSCAESKKQSSLAEKFNFCERAMNNQDSTAFLLSRNDIADIASKMGELHIMMESIEGAIDCFGSAIRIYSAEPVHDEKELLRMKCNMGLALNKNRLYDEAMDVFQEVLDGQRRVLAPGDLDIANTLHLMGNIYLERDFCTEAASCYEEALRIEANQENYNREESFGTIIDIGVAYMKMGSYDKARAQFEVVCRERKILSGEDHPQVASMLSFLASIHFKTGDNESALDLYQQSLKIRKDVLGDGHPLLGKTLVDMAGIHLSKDDYKETKLLCKKALSIFKRAKLPPGDEFMQEVRTIILQLDQALERVQDAAAASSESCNETESVSTMLSRLWPR